jgi:hypothetical protein
MSDSTLVVMLIWPLDKSLYWSLSPPTSNEGIESFYERPESVHPMPSSSNLLWVFYDAVSNSSLYSTKILEWLMNCKGFGRKWLVRLRFHLAIYMLGAEEKQEELLMSQWLVNFWWRCLWNMSWALCYYTRPFGHQVVGIVRIKIWNVQQLCAGAVIYAVRNFMLTELSLAILVLQYNEMFVCRTILLLPN